MKSLIAVAAIAVFTVGTAVAGKPWRFCDRQGDCRRQVEARHDGRQQLPFDRERSKN